MFHAVVFEALRVFDATGADGRKVAPRYGVKVGTASAERGGGEVVGGCMWHRSDIEQQLETGEGVVLVFCRSLPRRVLPRLLA